MLSLKYIRENVDKVKESLNLKKIDIDISCLIDLDVKHRKYLHEVEELRAERNSVSNLISKNKNLGGDVEKHISNMRNVSKKIKQIEADLKDVIDEINKIIYYIPNLVHPTVPIGNDDKSNIIIREWGDKPNFSFNPKSHLELSENLGLLDFKGAVNMSGSGFPLYIGQGSKLERSLINYMLDFHIDHHAYIELFPPFLSNKQAMQNTGQLPKFEDDMYSIQDDQLYCIPTAEVPVTNLHQRDLLDLASLPIKYVAYTACFRREAGSYGKDTKGLNRLHQFNKVELVKLVHPNNSYSELELLVSDVERLLQSFGLHYRVIELCSGDLSFSAAKCYDIEVWSPYEQKYLEVSSCSNFENFQSMRANIKFRNDKGNLDYVHTLNGSGVATPRLMIALLESNQTEDGSITLPSVLHKYMNVKNILCT